ncbi:MAG: ABC transporter ATP-binding protein [Phormidesmis sp.]
MEGVIISVPLLTFDQVTMRATAGIVEIIKAVTCSVEQGDFVALVGPSGAGKTSLLRLMNRLTEADSGRITFNGQDIHELPVVSLRRQVILVNQESRLLGMSVQEALGYPLRLRRVAPAEVAAAVAEWAERLKIPTDWMERQAIALSLGQRQRVAIARALIGEPKLLLLDEPTSAQDVGYSEFLLASLASWACQKKFAVVMSNHQIELMATHATRLWQMNSGRLVADLAASAVDWAQLRQMLVLAEQQAQTEWS